MVSFVNPQSLTICPTRIEVGLTLYSRSLALPSAKFSTSRACATVTILNISCVNKASGQIILSIKKSPRYSLDLSCLIAFKYSFLDTKQIVFIPLIFLAPKHATILASSRGEHAIKTSELFISAFFKTSISVALP